MLLNCGVGEVPWTARRSNQSILKAISPEYSLEGLMLKMKLQYFVHLTQGTDSLEKTVMLGKDWRWEEKGITEDEMVGWHHWLSGHEFEQALGVDDGQRSLACYTVHGVTKSWTWLSWSELNKPNICGLSVCLWYLIRHCQECTINKRYSLWFWWAHQLAG